MMAVIISFRQASTRFKLPKKRHLGSEAGRGAEGEELVEAEGGKDGRLGVPKCAVEAVGRGRTGEEE